MLIWLLVEAVVDMADPANSSGGTSWFGLGPPLVIALGLSLVGVLVMLARRAASAAFWAERPTAHDGPADPTDPADRTAEAAPAERSAGSVAARTAEPVARG